MMLGTLFRRRYLADTVVERFGRWRKPSDYQRAEALKRRDAGATLAAIAGAYALRSA